MESGSRTITEVQREAISEAMRLLVEEDHERGLDDTTEFGCPACSRRMSLAGSVLYDDIRLCNGCATAYELARIGGGLRSCAEYVSSRPHALRASAND